MAESGHPLVLRCSSQMTNWGSEKLRFLGELAGSGAVLLGLVFVGLELRQNTEAVQAATSQGVTELSIDWMAGIAASPELGEAWLKGLSDPTQLNELEAMRVTYIMRAYWLRMQTTYYQWRRGALNDADWAPYGVAICRQPSETSGGQVSRLRGSSWNDHKESMTAEFATFVEECWSQETLKQGAASGR